MKAIGYQSKAVGPGSISKFHECETYEKNIMVWFANEMLLLEYFLTEIQEEKVKNFSGILILHNLGQFLPKDPNHG